MVVSGNPNKRATNKMVSSGVKLKFIVASLLLLKGASFFSGARSPRVVCFSATSTSPVNTPNLNRRRSICRVLSPLKQTDEIVEVIDVDKVADLVVDDNRRNGKHLPAAAKQRKPAPVKRAKQQPKRNGQVDRRVIVPEMVARGLTNVTNATNDQIKQNIQAAEDVMELMGEISERMSLGSKEMLGDLSHVMEEKLVRLPEDKAKRVYQVSHRSH